MKIILLLALIMAVFSCAELREKLSPSPRPDNYYKFSIMQGSTDDTSTVLRLVYPNHIDPDIFITDSKQNNIKISSLKEFKHEYYEFKSVHLSLKNLNPEELYTIKISSPGGRWKDERTFRTLKDKKKMRILVASCLNDTFNEIGNKIWPEAFEHNPDVVFLIGDNIYADIYSGIYIGSSIPSSPGHLWRRHVDHAMTLKLYRLKHLTPTFVTWDDHDYGLNNGDNTYKHKNEAKDIFKAFFPTYENKYLKKGLGVGSLLTLAEQNFFFLDGRSFRDKNTKKNGTHLGKEQTKWLFKKLASSEKLNWLIKGDQFFGSHHKFEAFENDHPKDFQFFLKSLKDLGKRYVFLSGDRHLVEILKFTSKDVGFDIMEYTVSAVHTKVFEGALKRDYTSKRVDGFDNKANYGIFDIDAKPGKTDVTFKAYTIGDKLIHRTDSL